LTVLLPCGISNTSSKTETLCTSVPPQYSCYPALLMADKAKHVGSGLNAL
jgi:hypothetical protein